MFASRGSRLAMALAAGIAVAGAALGVHFAMRPARLTSGPAVSIAPPVSPEVPAVTSKPAFHASMRPLNERYAPTAYWDIHEAMTAAGKAARAGNYDAAAAVLEAPSLAKRSGVIVERYLAIRVEGGPASLSSSEASKLGYGLFDATYTIGQVGHRGVRQGEVVLLDGRTPSSPASLFARPEDYKAFKLAHVIALMDAWIHVWQDVAGVKPISETTRRYIASTSIRAGWSTVDALAVMMDFGIDVPQAILDDPRFPEWRPFANWTARLAEAAR